MPQDDEQKRQRFLKEVDQTIVLVNKEVIHERIPPITREHVMAFAVSVSRLRARYLEAAFKITDKNASDALGEAEISSLKRQRESYEEARASFEALTHAIERGYVDLAE